MRKIFYVIIMCFVIFSFNVFGDASYIINVGNYEKYSEAEEKLDLIKELNVEYKIERDVNYYIKIKVDDDRSLIKTTEYLNINNLNYLIEGIDNIEFSREDNNVLQSSLSSREFIKNFVFLNDITIKGNVGNYSYFFVIDENWEATGKPYLYIDLAFSEVYEKLNSNVNILVNGYPITSINLKSNTSVIRDKINIPIKYLKKGFNSVEFVTYHRISENLCDDNINPGNWITIKDNTYLNVVFEEERDKLDLSNYPYPYLNDKYADDIVNVKFIIDENTRDSVLSAYGILSAGFGKYYEFGYINSEIVILNEMNLDSIKDSNLIIAGSYEEIVKYFKDSITKDSLYFDDKVVIKEVSSPFNADKNLLMIISNNDKLLEKAAMSLNNRDYVKQMIKDYQILDEKDQIIFENEQINEKLKLNQFGYEDVLLKGVRKSSAGYLINIPKNWELLRGSKFVLIDRSSDLLNFERSSVTISINGQPIGSNSIRMSEEIENVYEFDIPKKFLSLNQFNLVIEYTMDSGDDECSDTGIDDTLWTIISENSYFDFKTREKEFHSLKDYTTPFIKDFKFNDLTFVIANELNEDYLRLVMNISSYLGKKINDFNGYKIVRANNFSDVDYDANLIIIGTPNDNEIIKEVNTNLYLKFNDSYLDFEDNDRITLLDDYNLNTSVIQIVKSVFNSNKDILVVTSLIPQNIDLADMYLSDTNKVSLLNGQVMIVGSNNYHKSFDFDKKNSTLNETSDISRIGAAQNDLEILVFVIAGMLIVLIVLIVVYSRKRRRE